jgi:hypothetical protein
MPRDWGEGSVKGPALLVLAAGMGNRYGGLKQMDRMGASGEVLLDYSVYDAIAAGFTKVVFVIRRSMEQDFSGLVMSRLRGHIEVEIAYQDMDTCIPAGNDWADCMAKRQKPWGTAHAVLCARDFLTEPFAVINADDFYGRQAFQSISVFFRQAASTPREEAAIVPYRLRQTLSEIGSVSRGVCQVEGLCLASVCEHTSIRSMGEHILSRDADGNEQELDPDTLVSMNYWGFMPSVFPLLTDFFNDFILLHKQDPKAECYLPAAVDHFIAHKKLRVRCLDAADGWFGVTYKEDRALAVQRIEAFIRQGVYPHVLWEKP